MAERLPPGTLIGEAYEIVRLLGTGGMGEVYVAVQLATGRERALKLMHARLVNDDKLRERFVQEARLASRIVSAHCVEVIGAGVEADSGTPWLAMELLHGQDLGAAVRAEGALSQRRALDLLEQICHAVGEAHRCWDNALSRPPPQGECVSGSLQADGCATTDREETVRGFETRIECQLSAHCNEGEVCCARLVERGHQGQPYYQEVKCLPRCEPPLRQLCDDIRGGDACPRLPSGRGTIAAECKRSALLPAGYLVCGYPQDSRGH